MCILVSPCMCIHSQQYHAEEVCWILDIPVTSVTVFVGQLDTPSSVQ